MFPSIAGTQLAFSCDNAQQKGSRIAVYQATTSDESNGQKLISISAMPLYKAKSHEELRWEDYNFTGKGGLDLSSSAVKSTSLRTASVSSTSVKPNIFGPTFTSLAPGTASWNYTGPTFNSLTSNSSNPFINAPSNSFSPFTTSTPTNSISPFTTSTPTNSFNPFTTSTPTNSFSPFTPRTNLTFPASTTSSVTLSPFNHNQFTNVATSLATHTSSPSATFTAFTNCSWSPVSSGMTSTSYQPTTFLNYNPCVPLTQNSNGPTVSQMSSSHVTSTEKPSSVASPFGILPACPRVHFDDYQPKHPVQYGISSIPVKDKPAPVKYSLLTTRHLSGRIKLPVRKYDPKSNAPKIPYFSDTKEIPVAVFVPRENPRALVIGPLKWPPSDTRENIHDGKFSSSTYEDTRGDMTKEEPLLSTILDVPAKLQQPDYYTQPQISELEAKERAEPRYCMHVKDFVVGRHGYGSIKFLGETDVRNVDIETDIQFNNREVIVYMDDSKKPPVGEGLNKPAEITLLNIKLFDKKTGMQHTNGSKVIKYTEMLKKKAVAQGAEFVSYDPVEGEWKFRVQHF